MGNCFFFVLFGTAEQRSKHFQTESYSCLEDVNIPSRDIRNINIYFVALSEQVCLQSPIQPIQTVYIAVIHHLVTRRYCRLASDVLNPTTAGA